MRKTGASPYGEKSPASLPADPRTGGQVVRETDMVCNRSIRRSIAETPEWIRTIDMPS
jgi:hypothetical protein